MKKTIFELIADIEKDIDSSNNFLSANKNNEIKKEEIEKYEKIKKWLDENGAIYPKLSFLVKYINIIGCKATEDIKKFLYVLYTI